MGLLDRLRGIGDPVDGEYRLVACSMSSGGAIYENCTMDGVVSAPGIAPTAVHHVSLVTPTAKWPSPGSVLPVTVDRKDPSKLKIRWDAVPSSAQVARRLAEDAARQQATAPESASRTVIVGDESRAQPGAAGGGLTQAESARAAAGDAASLGLRPASARLLAAHRIDVPAGLPDAPGGTWDLTLDVDGPDGAGWTSVLRIGFSSPERRAAIAQVGRSLPVVVDPLRHDRIAIDTSRLA